MTNPDVLCKPGDRPFYFALPRGARHHHVSEARQHVEATFGIAGPVEHVSTDPTFYLFRVTT